MSQLMSDAVWYRVQGDKKDYIDARLGGIQDLTTVASMEAYVRKGRTTETLFAAVTDATERLIRIQLGGVTGWLLDAEVGEWFVECEILFLDGSELTWPNKGKGIIVVGRQFG